MTQILEGDAVATLRRLREEKQHFALTFLDPPFNQGKEYAYTTDDLPQEAYWEWMREVCALAYELTLPGGAIYFMQREKNTEFVLRVLRETGWTLQNLIIWSKRTSAVPGEYRFGKQYQIIAFATKGKPRVFHRLRADVPLRPEYQKPRAQGMFLTDVWDDIRELTSGYLAGPEALRYPTGERFHKQQAPVALLLRILLSSTSPGDWVLDPFAGTGTTGVVAQQIGRYAVLIEIDPKNVACIRQRLSTPRPADNVEKWRHYYRFTPNLEKIWGKPLNLPSSLQQLSLFERGY